MARPGEYRRMNSSTIAPLSGIVGIEACAQDAACAPDHPRRSRPARSRDLCDRPKSARAEPGRQRRQRLGNLPTVDGSSVDLHLGHRLQLPAGDPTHRVQIEQRIGAPVRAMGASCCHRCSILPQRGRLGLRRRDVLQRCIRCFACAEENPPTRELPCTVLALTFLLSRNSV